MRRRLSGWLAIICLGVTLGGCNSSADSGDTTAAETATTGATTVSDAPSKDEYIAEADRLCREAVIQQYPVYLEVQALREGASGRELLEDPELMVANARLQSRLRRIEAKLTDDLRALETPGDGGADEYISLREELEQTYLDYWPKTRRFLTNPTRESMKPVQEVARIYLELNDQMREASTAYGLVDCPRIHPEAPAPTA